MSKAETEHENITQTYAEVGKMERHALSIQARLRMLASLWLWGCFAGMAYILTENLNIHIPNELIFLGINTTGIIGICMLWMLDLKVYHRQLIWIMSEALYLESKYSWLPRLRKFRYASYCHHDSSPRMVWYYFVQASILLLIGAGSLIVWLKKHIPDGVAGYASLYVIITSLIIIIVYILTDDKVPMIDKISKRKH